jgi:hypothetical protein
MDTRMIIVLLLTFIINVIGTLAYSTRITGISTRKIAISFSIFNILILISRTANSFQGPLLSKKITLMASHADNGVIMTFRYVLLAATFGCIFGALVMPTFQRLFYKAVMSFDIYRSVPKLLLHSFSKSGVTQFKKCIKVPSKNNFHQLKKLEGMPKKVIVFNVLATALSTTAVLSSMYAGVINPSAVSTCSYLTGIVSSVATILMYVFIDPNLSIMTDDVLQGKRSESSFKRCVLFMVSSRIAGTVVAQIIFIPGAVVIAYIAGIM